MTFPRHPSTQSGNRPLSRMRTYTTLSFILLVGFYALLVASGSSDPVHLYVTLGVGAIVTEYAFHWERRPPRWISAIAITAALGQWIYTIVIGQSASSSVLLGTVLAIRVTQLRGRAFYLAATAALALIVACPLIIGAVTGQFLAPYAVSGIFGWAGTLLAFSLNRYGFNLYLEIDSARQVSAELAVAEERYRFAADLHDIQGHTLHVIKLKTQLAEKLIDRDPDAAREQLREAQQLITETVANTRDLAFGDRHVALASETANAEQLFAAAGIRWTLEGERTRDTHDELLALVVREATTNILRHSQATAVTVTLSAEGVTVVNDGSPASVRSPSGLARLGERFAAAGGRLETSSVDGRFTTKAVAG
ncbi:MAG: sensor histidine kinase [Microbacteriaceae bacterium]